VVSESSKHSSLSCELIIPFSWAVTDGMDDNALVLIDADNYSRLQIIQGLEESVSDALDELPGLAQEIQRMDSKINVLLELVAHIATQDSGLPRATSLVLGADFIQWVSQRPTPELGSELRMELFLERRFPFPLVFSGVVELVSPHHSAAQVLVKLHSMSGGMQELLEKFIFRCHRRHIARMKREGL